MLSIQVWLGNILKFTEIHQILIQNFERNFEFCQMASRTHVPQTRNAHLTKYDPLHSATDKLLGYEQRIQL